jgi:antitoxin (DNA-binding transcriptional repressor) of toxin-antitoxin stability system
MPKEIDALEMQAHFDDMLKRVENGEHFYIMLQGKRIAKLVPMREKPSSRQGGTLKGKIRIAQDFDEPLKDFEDYAS